MTEDSMHRTPNAALARNSGPSTEDVETRMRRDLASRFRMVANRDGVPEPRWFEEDVQALVAAVLASDWLAAHTAAAKREGARAVVEAVEAAWSAIPNPQHPGTGAALRLAARAAAEQTGGA